MPAPRILIVTASFGEGHNSAARNLAMGLEGQGAVCLVADPCMRAMPALTNMLCNCYRYITTHLPRLWYRIYLSTDDMDLSRQRSYVMRKPENDLARLLDEFQPDAVVSTYPIYPYFLDRILSAKQKRPAVFTVITDSIEINASWEKSAKYHLGGDGSIYARWIDSSGPASRALSRYRVSCPSAVCNHAWSGWRGRSRSVSRVVFSDG